MTEEGEWRKFVYRENASTDGGTSEEDFGCIGQNCSSV